MQDAECQMQSECGGILSIRIHHLVLLDVRLVFGVLGGEGLQCTGGSLGSKAARTIIRDGSRAAWVVILDQTYRVESALERSISQEWTYCIHE